MLASDMLRAQMRKPRQRQEDRLQRQVVEFLRLVAPGYVTFAVANGGGRSKAEAGILKATGVLAGVPDLVLVGPLGQAHFIELKTAKGKPSQAQRDLHARFAVMGVPYAVARSLDDVRVALEAWKISTRESYP